MTSIFLLFLSILPAVLLMVFIYFQDKYQKEPIKSLLKAFFGGILAIVFVSVTDSIIELTFGLVPIFSDTVFYQAFMTAGIPEEVCKLLIFLMFIWRDKNFDEYFDGIVYASFIGLGFACVENIMYVFSAASESFLGGFATSIVRALLSVPGHFLFGVIMGYFLSMAKFDPEKRSKHIWTGLLFAILAHGLFDWLLMFADRLETGLVLFIYAGFLVGDFFLWRFSIKLIRKQQENSRLQAETSAQTIENETISNTGYDPEYKQIDWNAGDRQ